MVMDAAVPCSGSWNTLPMNAARRCSLKFVMSVPFSEIVPVSGMYRPATRFSSVDLPAPLLPMTVTNRPCGTVRLTRSTAIFVDPPPTGKLLDTFLMLNTGEFIPFQFHSPQTPAHSSLV